MPTDQIFAELKIHLHFLLDAPYEKRMEALSRIRSLIQVLKNGKCVEGHAGNVRVFDDMLWFCDLLDSPAYRNNDIDWGHVNWLGVLLDSVRSRLSTYA